MKWKVYQAIQNCAPFLRRLRNVISIDVCIMASRVPDENSSSIVWTSETLAAGRSTVGPNTVARFWRDILFSVSFSATLQKSMQIHAVIYTFTTSSTNATYNDNDDKNWVLWVVLPLLWILFKPRNKPSQSKSRENEKNSNAAAMLPGDTTH